METTVPIRDFYLGPGRVDLKRGEILTHVIIPAKEYQGYHGNYIKYSMRKAMDIATLSCSVVSKVNTEKNILEDVRRASVRRSTQEIPGGHPGSSVCRSAEKSQKER